MRKRKSPIALVTVLVVVASVAFGFQYATNRGPESQATAPPAPAPDDVKPVGEARPGVSSNDVKSMVTQSMGGASSKPMVRPGPPGMPGGPGGGPSILSSVPASGSVKPEKPKPNSSSTSTQWYNDESAYGKSGN